MATLPQVNQFEVDQTLMSGTLPMAMTTMTKLAHFEMWGTMLSGSLAPEIVRALAPRLENLELDRTWLSGTVPITTVAVVVVPQKRHPTVDRCRPGNAMSHITRGM